MNKQILHATLLALFLQPITLFGTDEPEQQTPSYTIPVINIPISFEQKDYELSDHAITYIASQHALLIHLQKNDDLMPLPTMIGQHILLWASKSIIGFLSTIGHELGHAITWQQSGNCETNPSIVVKYSSATLHTGMYPGTTHTTVNTNHSLAKNRKILLSNSEQQADLHNIITTDKESYLEWARKVKKRCYEDIAVYLAGPAANILTAAALIYTFSKTPILWPKNINGYGYAAILAINPIFETFCDLLPFYDDDTKIWSDGAQTWDAWQRIQEIEEITEQVRALPDGSEVALYFCDE